VDFPEERWRNRDLSLLDGCWVLGRPNRATLHRGDGRSIEGTQRAGEYCFSGNGRGTGQATADFPGVRVDCRAPIAADFQPDGQLAIRRPQVDCNPPDIRWGVNSTNQATCRRLNDRELTCRGEDGNEQLFQRRQGQQR
jgi:hypothetical protein